MEWISDVSSDFSQRVSTIQRHVFKVHKFLTSYSSSTLSRVTFFKSFKIEPGQIVMLKERREALI